MKYLITQFCIISLLLLTCPNSISAKVIDSTIITHEQYKHFVDSASPTIRYQYGKVSLKDIADIDVPKGYKFIPAAQAQMIVHKLWGNPEDEDILGLIVHESYTLATDNLFWSYIITYDESGYVKDDEADKIDYDELLKQMKEDEPGNNIWRKEHGYDTTHLIGWAIKPFYDHKHKVLHWAKKLEFESNNYATINYDVKILGRRGILCLQAVGTDDEMYDINKSIPAMLTIATFKEGNQYDDFDPSVDKVATYSISGLIAGTFLAKTGMLALLMKNIKLLLLGLFGGFAAMRHKIVALFTRKKKKPDLSDYFPTRPESPPAITKDEDKSTAGNNSTAINDDNPKGKKG